MSGGQQQRVSIGRAMMNEPALMLADEPTGNLDSKASDEIISLLRHSNKKYNQTVIIITHDEKIALEADRIITIDDGKVKIKIPRIIYIRKCSVTIDVKQRHIYIMLV